MSRVYAYAQTLLICAFAAVDLFVRAPFLFSSAIVSYAGGVFCVAAIVLILVAIRTLREVVQVSPEPKPDGHLVTSGIYRWLRHPIYTAIVLAVVGLWLRKPTIALAIAGAVVVIFLVVKSRYEEHLLVERYPGYQEYRRQTLGVVPGL
jgi:protein-S-isoprenylcysteine O-methyltransferase Ste14